MGDGEVLCLVESTHVRSFMSDVVCGGVRYTRTGPTPWVMERYYVRLSECLGLDPDRKADLEHPRLLIIDRKVEKGRAFENADLVQRQLQTSFPTVTVAMQK